MKVDSFEVADKIIVEYGVNEEDWFEYYDTYAQASDWDTALAYCKEKGYPEVVAEALYWNCE